jgi:hypothetical protein
MRSEIQLGVFLKFCHFIILSSRILNHIFQQPISNIFQTENDKFHILRRAVATSVFFKDLFAE